MGGYVDLTGKHIGALTVIEDAGRKFYPDGSSKVLWKCQCSCGKIVIRTGTYLRKSPNPSCGCKPRSYNPKIDDLTGKMFGHLKPIEYISSDHFPNHTGRWKCICTLCGKETFVTRCNLTHGMQTSCGCQKHHETAVPRKDLIGQTFGRLTVIERADDHIAQTGPRAGRHSVQWLCQCSCGKTTIATTNKLTSGRKLSCGCITKEQKQEKALSHVGEVQYSYFSKLKMELTEYIDSTNVTVRFEDGCIRDHVRYTAFRKGQVAHPDFGIGKVFYGYLIKNRAFEVHGIPYWYVIPPDSKEMDIMTAQQMLPVEP